MRISAISHNYNNQKIDLQKSAVQKISFSASANESKLFKPISKPYNKFMDYLTTGLAKGFVKLLENKYIKKFIEKTKNSNLVQNLTVLNSFIISGFYMQQTLKNKNLDSEKKKTLAINQGLTCAVSTLIGLFINDKTDKFIEKHFADKYSAVALKSGGPKEAINLFHGINAAKSIIIFGIIYRFITPVVMTPIANHIGNKLQEKKEAKLAGKQV